MAGNHSKHISALNRNVIYCCNSEAREMREHRDRGPGWQIHAPPSRLPDTCQQSNMRTCALSRCPHGYRPLRSRWVLMNDSNT